jgi:hypothetical protein
MSTLELMQFQNLACNDLTPMISLFAESEMGPAAIRSGGSPIRTLVTANADFDIDLKLYPPCHSQAQVEVSGLPH